MLILLAFQSNILVILGNLCSGRRAGPGQYQRSHLVQRLQRVQRVEAGLGAVHVEACGWREAEFHVSCIILGALDSKTTHSMIPGHVISSRFVVFLRSADKTCRVSRDTECSLTCLLWPGRPKL